MRHVFRRSAWAGNAALILIGALLMTAGIGGIAAAAPSSPPGPACSATASASCNALVVLQQVSGQTAVTVNFNVQPVTSPLPPVWVQIFSPSKQLIQGPVQVQPQPPSTVGSVYSVVYTVYQALGSLFAPVANVLGSVYNNIAVLYSVYLAGPPTPPPPAPPPSTGGAPPASPPGKTITVGANLPVGSLGITTAIVGGVQINASVLQLNGSQLTQAVSSLGTGTSNLQIQLTTSSVPSGNAALVNVPSDAISALTAAGKGVEVDTPSGNITLSSTVLSQISAQLPAGDQAQIEVTPLPESQISTIISSATTSGGIYQVGGQTVQVSVNVVNSTGQTVGNFEPSGGATVNLTLPYSSGVSGTDADKLGIYYYDQSTGSWQYVGGKTDLTTGTVSVDTTHLSTYAVLLDSQTFPDIQGYWAQSDIEIMIAHHIVDGISATAFDPTGAVTRAEFALMLARALNLSMPTPSTAPFSDVPVTSPYAGAIAAAVQAGIVNGYPDGTFRPDANISRQELAVMVDRAMTAANQPTSLLPAQIPTLLAPFGDAGQLAGWAQQAVAADIEQHIIHGVTATTLDPTATTTRAEATVMLQRLLAYLGTL